MVKKGIRKGRFVSVHDISEGGVFVALMESAMVRGLGFYVDCDHRVRKDAFLFGEGQSRVVVSVGKVDKEVVERFLGTNHCPFLCLGYVTTGVLTIDGQDFGEIESWRRVYDEEIGKKMNE